MYECYSDGCYTLSVVCVASQSCFQPETSYTNSPSASLVTVVRNICTRVCILAAATIWGLLKAPICGSTVGGCMRVAAVSIWRSMVTTTDNQIPVYGVSARWGCLMWGVCMWWMSTSYSLCLSILWGSLCKWWRCTSVEWDRVTGTRTGQRRWACVCVCVLVHVGAHCEWRKC